MNRVRLCDRLFVVLEVPAPLAGMSFPAPETDWPALHRLGFRRVVRLHPSDYDPTPLVTSISQGIAQMPLVLREQVGEFN